MVFHYEEVLYQVYVPFTFTFNDPECSTVSLVCCMLPGERAGAVHMHERGDKTDEGMRYRRRTYHTHEQVR